MANKRNQRRGQTVRQKQEQLCSGRKKTRWNPLGRALLYCDLVFLAVSSLLESNGLISGQAGAVCTVIAILALLAALWLLFRRGNGTRL